MRPFLNKIIDLESQTKMMRQYIMKTNMCYSCYDIFSFM